MGKVRTSQQGFTIIEALLLVLVLAVIGFGGYFVWHAQKTSKIDKGTPTPTNANATTNSASTKPTQTTQQYLKIPELGIELPLSSTVSDLTYGTNKDMNGNTVPGFVTIDSSSKLHTLFDEIDPDCGNTDPTTSVFGEMLATTAPGVNQTAKATATVNGKNYYLFSKGGYAACGTGTFSPTAAQQAQLDAYTQAVDDAVSNARAL